jgi:Putative MetA-pathway of phenol degradation
MHSCTTLTIISLLLAISSKNCLAGAPASQPTTPADKSGYTLFNPTPDNLLRDFSADRPDKTNGAITVDAGRFQIETDIANYTRDGHGFNKQELWAYGNANLRVGLCNQADLQLMVPLVEHASGSTGIGDLAVAVKTNLWGNDGGDSAAGFEAILALPTGSHQFTADTMQASLLGIYQQSLGSFDASMNAGVNIAANDANNGHHTEIVGSISIGHEIAGPVSAYAEFYTSVPTSHSHDWVGTIDTGLLWAVTKNLQLDAGVNIGVTEAADDLQVFVGVSWRL